MDSEVNTYWVHAPAWIRAGCHVAGAALSLTTSHAAGAVLKPHPPNISRTLVKAVQ